MKKSILYFALLVMVTVTVTFCLVQGCGSTRYCISAKRSPGLAASAFLVKDAEHMFPSDVEFNTEEYKTYDENPFLAVAAHPLSTFGADVDTASYANTRRMLMQDNCLPPKDAVRVEEFLNYFTYDYPQPKGDDTFSTTFEMSACPWNPAHQLLLIGVQGKATPLENLPPSNFTFLIDNSGSMREELSLLRQSMLMLVDQLRPQDFVSIVTYGGGAQTLLDSVSGKDKEKIKSVLEQLTADGYTPGSQGIITAYDLAAKNFIKGGNNRVILVTDGDFNVGVSSESTLVSLIKAKCATGVYLTAIGMGYGNFKDNKLKMLANKGNGNYIYLDNLREARNALVNEMSGRMFTLARDVKFQLEFNPAQVFGYRLIGYELRKLQDRDFNDDTKDSGEVGVGHQVTALYELVMADAPASVKTAMAGNVDPLKYQTPAAPVPAAAGDILTFKLRYQQPEGDAPSTLQTFVLAAPPAPTANWNWASSVAEFALLLRGSEYKGYADFAAVKQRAQQNLGPDPESQRAEFLTLVTAAQKLNKE